jgi:diguanylate cyclase (GGDEF)-like protein
MIRILEPSSLRIFSPTDLSALYERPRSKDSWFHQWFGWFSWPHSYFGKVFLLAFVATYVPLISIISYIILGPRDISKLMVFWLVVLATLSGTLFFIWAFHHLFKPLLLACQALNTYFDRGQVLQLPTRWDDQGGLLLSKVAYAIRTFEQRRLVLEQLAAEDFLTGLHNRRAAEDRLRQCLSLVARDQLAICVALMDIDWFKQINDQYGHAAGDQVLIALSRHLKQILRESDWAARWGGEEFLIVLFSEIEGTENALQRIRTDLAGLTVVVDNAEVRFTVSIGFTVAQLDDPVLSCVERADRALYQAKQAGRNHVHACETVEC